VSRVFASQLLRERLNLDPVQPPAITPFDNLPRLHVTSLFGVNFVVEAG